MDYETLVSRLKFDEKGLIPVVVQDYVTHEVLTLAYMNRESLKITLEEKRTCFYSRSRQLWRKGRNQEHADAGFPHRRLRRRRALVAQVKRPVPPATPAASCFFNGLYENQDIRPFSLSALMEVIAGRKTSPRKAATPPISLRRAGTRSQEGRRGMHRVLIGGAKGDRAETTYELAIWSTTPWC